MLLFLGFVAVALFVIGGVLVFQSYTNLPNPESMVSKSDLKNAEGELAQVRKYEGELKVSLDSLTAELEETKGKLAEAKKSGEDTEALKAQEAEYKAKIQELEKNLNAVTANAEKIKAAGDEENQKLTSELEQVVTKIEEVETEVAAANEAQRQAIEEAVAAATPPPAPPPSPPARGESPEEIKKVKDMNTHLVEKDERLQMELTKSRTQLTGLEAICKELKMQLGQDKG